MGRQKKIIITLPRLLRHDALNNLMFGYVLGVTSALPSVTITKAIELFMDDFNLSEDDYPAESAFVTYYRLYNEYRDYRKEE